MRRSFTRLTALLLALLLAAAFLPACKEETDPTSAVSPGSDSAAAGSGAVSPEEPSETSGETLRYQDPVDILAEYPAYNFSSSALVIATDPAASVCTYREMLSASLSDVFSAIEKKYNTFVYLQTYPKDDLFESCRSAVVNGTYFADLVAIPLSELPRYQKANLLMPIRLLPFFRDTDPGVDAVGMEALSVNGEQYAVLGSGALSQMGITTLLVNEDLLRSLGISEDPGALAREGNWTWEKLIGILNTVREKSPETVLLGTTLDAARVRQAVTACCATAEGANSLLAKLPLDGMPAGSEASRAFNEGKLLFLFTTLDGLYEYPHSDGVWSSLPLPKENEADEGYSCLYDPQTTYVYVVLDRTVRSDYAGLYLHAVTAAADGSCLSSLAYELLSGYVRTETTIKLLPTLLKSGKVGK